MNKKERLLEMIDQIKMYEPNPSEELTAKLAQAEEKLQELSVEELDQLTDNVFSTPPAQRKFDPLHPEYLLQSSYSEIERLARQEGAHPKLDEVVKAMQHYFGIEEKDGYFP